MGNRIHGNLESLRTRRELGASNHRLEQAFARLSSGRRITGAADDPAGLAISERMRAQLRSLSQAAHNARSGIDLVRTADSGLNETTENLHRLRELAVQGSNGALSAEDHATLNQEAQALTAEIDRVATTTEFNGTAVLDGSADTSLQVGSDAGETIDLPSVDATAEALGIHTVDLTTQTAAAAAIADIDLAIESVSAERGNLGSYARELSERQQSVLAARDNLATAEEQITSLDVALESARLAREHVLSNAGIATLLQANTQPQRALGLLQ